MNEDTETTPAAELEAPELNNLVMCRTCDYWEVLGDNPEAWGECRWLGETALPPLPFWAAKLIQQGYGSISPTTRGCPAHSKNGD